jgi:MFS family permease
MFRGFLGGNVVSTCGMWVQNIAAAVLMYDLTGWNLMVGAVSAAQFVPMLLFPLWAGALTDRIDRAGC